MPEVYEPNADLRGRAHVKSMDEYREEYARSLIGICFLAAQPPRWGFSEQFRLVRTQHRNSFFSTLFLDVF